MTTLTERFIRGLQEYNLTVEEVRGWKYCGGNRSRHLNYFKLCCPDDDIPEHTDKCACGHHISENCYITDGVRILVLGNCCIKRFIPKAKRTCERCDKPHRRTKYNLCFDCQYS